MNFDVVIVGAGIVGAACARRLAADGLRVAVAEERAVATGTTAAGMGHLVVMDDSEAQFALTEYSRRLWNELAPSLPETNEYEFCGTIWVAADGEEMDEVARKHQYYAERGVRSEILDERSLREAEPNLREGLAGGLLVKDDSVVYQIGAAKFLLDEAVSNGTVMFAGSRVAALDEAGAVLADGTQIEAALVLNAAGTGASGLTPGLPIRKKKGHLVITERYPGFVSHQLVELGYIKSAHASEADSVAFNVQPRETGQVLLGSSRQYDRDDAGIDLVDAGEPEETLERRRGIG